MATNVNSQIIKKLAHHLDTDQFDQVKPLLAKECLYDSPGGQLKGPDQIVNSYKEHTEYAHSTFDKVIYESSCKQFITFNSQNLVSKIKHEEIPGEYQRLKEFYHEIGL